jgi:hypothetical protein
MRQVVAKKHGDKIKLLQNSIRIFETETLRGPHSKGFVELHIRKCTCPSNMYIFPESLSVLIYASVGQTQLETDGVVPSQMLLFSRGAVNCNRALRPAISPLLRARDTIGMLFTVGNGLPQILGSLSHH